MALSRRNFIQTVGAGGAGLLTATAVVAQAREALAALGLNELEVQAALGGSGSAPIKISSNENPRGPGDAAIDAVLKRANYRLGRYPDNREELKTTIAKKLGVAPENILIATGSTATIYATGLAFLSPSRPLVAGLPSFEVPRTVSVPVWDVEKRKIPVRTVPLDAALKLDLNGMADVAKGAGIFLICNPNNPTATAVSAKAVADAVARVRKESPDTAIVIDEAYIDYATDPAVSTAAPLAVEHPNVVVTRTASKAFGMAGLRFGYAVAQPKTLTRLSEVWGMGDVNVLTAAAVIASLNDPAHMEQERQENRRVREFTMTAFKEMGYSSTDSQANFIFVNIRRPAKEFQAACAKSGLLVAREFPPLEKTHARISIGTREEMEKAVEVFRKVLSVSPTAA